MFKKVVILKLVPLFDLYDPFEHHFTVYSFTRFLGKKIKKLYVGFASYCIKHRLLKLKLLKNNSMYV